jgi:trans-2-enoyl-CoA reductase
MVNQSLVYRAFGRPEEVLEYVESPVQKLGVDEVLVKLLYSSINPSDLGLIMGAYGKKMNLPAVAGRVGAGEIMDVGKSIDPKLIGSLVKVPESVGCWQKYGIVSGKGLFRIPFTLDLQQAAVSFINPFTAKLLLTEIVKLESGDVILQNAGNSALGIVLDELAKAKGITCVSTVRRKELIPELNAIGMKNVLVDDDDLYEKMLANTHSRKAVLAINTIGGMSASRQFKCIADGGTQVTLGAMTGEAIRFPTRYLIFNDIRIRGFWMDRWMRENSDRYRVIMDEIFEEIQQGVIHTPISRVYGLSEFQDALIANAQPRLGKVLFRL